MNIDIYSDRAKQAIQSAQSLAGQTAPAAAWKNSQLILMAILEQLRHVADARGKRPAADAVPDSGTRLQRLGIQPPDPSWGNMIAGGRELIVVAPWVAIAPGLLLVVTVLLATLLGDAVRDRIAGERADAT